MRRRLASLLLPVAAGALVPAEAAESVTYNKQIAPIIYNNCSICHRPGEAAPFALLSYQDVAKRGKLIAQVTKSQYMPPWKAEKTSFNFADERRLSESDVKLIDEWVKAGMPEGKAADAPPAPKFASGWRLGEPDMVIEVPVAFKVPADGADIYRNISIPLGLTEDKWLTAIDMKPTARPVVHHVLYFSDPTGKTHQRQDGDQPGFGGIIPSPNAAGLGGWAVGAQPHMQPEGLALKLPKGSDFIVQYHFHPDGKVETEKATLGLYFAKEAPKRTLTGIQLPPAFGLFAGIDIPPGEKDYVIKDSFTLPVDYDAISVGAHAHYIATKMKMTATLPNGETLTLLSIKDWDFAWQDRYYFDHFIPLPKGTRIDSEVHWNNTLENPRNPSNPLIRVQWGEQSADEMGAVGLQGVPHEESDLKTLQAAVQQHQMRQAQDRIKADPGFMKRVQTMFGGSPLQ
jgi:mono/diheme cytochrome c family protein